MGRVGTATVVGFLGCCLALQGCIETAASPREKMVRACDNLADGLEAGTGARNRRDLQEAARWTRRAVAQDEKLRPVADSFERIVQDTVFDHDRADRDPALLRNATQRAVAGCDAYADPEVKARLHAVIGG